MFDANADHIPLEERFFVVVDSVNPILEDSGVCRGVVLLAIHKVKYEGRHSPRTKETHLFKTIGGEPIIYSEPVKLPHGWLRYIGRPSGEGFINEHHKTKALAFLGGEWE